MKLKDLRLERPFDTGMSCYLVRIKSEATDILLPKYLYYMLEYITTSGKLKSLQYSEMKKIQKHDLENIKINGIDKLSKLKELVAFLNCDMTELQKNDIVYCVAGTYFGKALFIDDDILKVK